MRRRCHRGFCTPCRRLVRIRRTETERGIEIGIETKGGIEGRGRGKDREMSGVSGSGNASGTRTETRTEIETGIEIDESRCGITNASARGAW